MNTYILWLLVRWVGLSALIVNGRPCVSKIHGALIPESFQTWEIQGKETFKIGRKTQLIRLYQLAKYRSSLPSECALCQWRGGTISCDTKPVSFPALEVGASGPVALPWMQGTHAVGTRTMLSYFGGTKEHHTQKTTKLTNPHQIFSFCLKVPGNLW